MPEILYQVNKTILGRMASLSHDARMQLELAGNVPLPDHFYFVRAVATEWGKPMFPIILLGGWLLIRYWKTVRLPLAATLVVVFIMTMGWRFQAERYIYPLWCLLCLLGGLGFSQILEQIQTFLSRRVSNH